MSKEQIIASDQLCRITLWPEIAQTIETNSTHSNQLTEGKLTLRITEWTNQSQSNY